MKPESNRFVTKSTYKESREPAGLGVAWGRNKIAVKRRANGEAIERYCCLHARPDIFNRSYLQLIKNGLRALDPSTAPFYSAGQRSVKAGQARNLSPATRIDWSWFREVSTRRRILLPSAFNSIFSTSLPVYFTGSSNGCACHKNPTAAKLSALLELIERDAFIFYWRTGNEFQPISFRRSNAKTDKLLAPFKGLRSGITCYLLKTEFPVSTIVSVFKGKKKKGTPRLLLAAAAHADPWVALDKSLSELGLALELWKSVTPPVSEREHPRNFERILWSFSDHVMLYGHYDFHKPMTLFRSESKSQIPFEKIPDQSTGSAGKDLRLLIECFEMNGIRLYLRDNTTRRAKKNGYFVYRAFSPDLIPIEPMHRFRPLGQRRLFELAPKLGLKVQPNSLKDLNPWPHPFP